MPITGSEEIIVRNMSRRELDLAVEWAAREGWNPGIHDAECFYAADPNGFFVAERDGEPVGCLSAVAYDERFGFAGFYIVKPGLRGQGVGHQLVLKASAYMGSRSVGNDAVVAQQEIYRKYGFRLAYRNMRYRGTAAAAAIDGPEIIGLDRVPFDRLTAYDREIFRAERPAFLKCWIGQPEGVALGHVTEGQLSGYGVMRKCRQGYKIGPLFADRADIAERLLLSLSDRAAGEAIFIDIPETNAAAGALVRRQGMEMVFETARMYRGDPPSVPLQKIFGVTSFELG